MGKVIDFEPVTIEIPADVIERAAARVASFYKSETGRSYPEWAIIKAIKDVFEERVETLGEDIEDLLTTPSTDEAFLFRRYLDEALESVNVFEADQESPLAAETPQAERLSVFNGFRAYSADRLAAMASYIAARGHDIYKTKLNKLLFYSDFVNYYLHGQSISGSRYVHLPFGPVPENYENVLTKAADARQVELVPAGTDALMIAAGELDAARRELSSEEMATLDWVLDNYGKLSTSAISELSHREKAYKFTKQGEDIAYAYAKFFEKLPELSRPTTGH